MVVPSDAWALQKYWAPAARVCPSVKPVSVVVSWTVTVVNVDVNAGSVATWKVYVTDPIEPDRVELSTRNAGRGVVTVTPPTG